MTSDEQIIEKRNIRKATIPFEEDSLMLFHETKSSCRSSWKTKVYLPMQRFRDIVRKYRANAYYYAVVPKDPSKDFVMDNVTLVSRKAMRKLRTNWNVSFF